jgi:hypothetical protein
MLTRGWSSVALGSKTPKMTDAKFVVTPLRLKRLHADILVSAKIAWILIVETPPG